MTKSTKVGGKLGAFPTRRDDLTMMHCFSGDVSYCQNSLKEGYIRDYIGDYYRAY